MRLCRNTIEPLTCLKLASFIYISDVKSHWHHISINISVVIRVLTRAGGRCRCGRMVAFECFKTTARSVFPWSDVIQLVWPWADRVGSHWSYRWSLRPWAHWISTHWLDDIEWLFVRRWQVRFDALKWKLLRVIYRRFVEVRHRVHLRVANVHRYNTGSVYVVTTTRAISEHFWSFREWGRHGCHV